ncbi:MAG: dTDP-4-dehydrorhamnose reductase [Pseudomonadota bacterium]
MIILLSGGQGQLAYDCKELLGTDHQVVVPEEKDLDITDPKKVTEKIRAVKPDVVLNCAAYTDVDGCETKKELAWKINVDGARNLAMGVAEFGGKLIHISTDYVFDGNRVPPEPYTEEDSPNPLSEYGKSKLEGEKAVIEICPRYAIVRTAWLYGIGGRNFLKTILRLALKTPKGSLRVVNDQYGSPTWSRSLALQILKLIETDGTGIYHATSEGYCTWYEVAGHFLNKMEIPVQIIPCTSEEYPTPAQRPFNSILENKRLKEAGINVMRDWKEDIDEFVEAYKEDLKASF